MFIPLTVSANTAAAGFLLGPVTHNGQAAGDGDVDEEEEDGGVEHWSQTGKSQAGCTSLRGGGGLKE